MMWCTPTARVARFYAMAFIFELYRKHTGIGLGDDESMDAADDDVNDSGDGRRE